MLLKRIIKYLLVLVAIFVITFIFFTQIYLNSFKSFFESRISNTLDLDKFRYEKIEGNLVKGFTLFNLKIKSDNYIYTASEFDIDFDIIDIFTGFKRIDSIKSKDATLIISENYKQEASFNSFEIEEINLDNLSIVYQNHTLFIDNSNLLLVKDEENHLIQGKVLGSFLDSNFEVRNLNVDLMKPYKIKFLLHLDNQKYPFDTDLIFTDEGISIKSAVNDFSFDLTLLLEDFYKGSFDLNDLNYKGYLIENYSGSYILDSNNIALELSNLINHLDITYNIKKEEYRFKIHSNSILFDYINFTGMEISGYGKKIDELYANIYLDKVNIFNKEFSGLDGILRYIGPSEIYLNIQKDNEIDISLSFSDNFLNMDRIKIQLDKGKRLFLKNQEIFISEDNIYGKDILLNYNNGSMLIEEFFFNNFKDYSFELSFDKLELDFFDYFDATGYIDGKFHIINKKDKIPTFLSNFKIENLKYLDYKFDMVELIGSFDKNRISLSNLKIFNEFGSLDIAGSFSLSDFDINSIENLDIKIRNKNFKLAIIDQLFFKQGLEGLISGSLNLKGDINAPIIVGNTLIEDFKYDKISADSLKIKTTIKDGSLMVNYFDLYSDKGSYLLRGSIPIDILTSGLNSIEDRGSYLDLNLKCSNIKSLDIITNYVTFIDSIEFIDSPYLDLNFVSNNKGEIDVFGDFIFSNSNIYTFYNDTPIIDVSGNLRYENYKLNIKNLDGFLGKEKKDFKKNIIVSGDILINSLFDNFRYNINANAKKIYLKSSYGGFFGHADGEFNISGKDTVSIVGEAIPEPYNFTIYNIFDDRSFDIFEDKTSSVIYNYDIKLPFNNGINISTENYNIKALGELRMLSLYGEDFNYIGIMNIENGDFIFNGNSFRNTKGQILFTPHDNNPILDLETTTDFYSDEILINFFGTLDKPSIVLDYNGNSEFSEKSLLQYLAFKGTSDEILESNQLGNILTGVLQEQFSKEIKKITSLDEFRISTTYFNQNTSSDTELYLGKHIQKDIYLNTKYNIGENELTEFEIQHNIDDKSQIILNNDKSESDKWTVKYRIKLKN